MKMNEMKIPVGSSDFSEYRKQGYYYIDKTGLICELLKTTATKVTLITRPRRFGKTLNMSMLSCFFDIREKSSSLFRGLEISRHKELCRQWMNQYPTVFVTFKTVDGRNYDEAYAMLCAVISAVCIEHYGILKDETLNPVQKNIFRRLAEKTASLEEVKNSLSLITQMLHAHYKKPVVLLIDEYDVPLAKASAKGFYDDMLDAVKGLLQAVKDNPSLRCAVITGCLRIAKESIFTGTNNFVSDTITDTRLNEYFGFTQQDVDRLLTSAGLDAHAGDIKTWYNGYSFGEFNIYCPWDVMNHVNALLLNPDAKPKGYWKNTSDNAIIRTFIEHSGSDITQKFEKLLAGGVIVQKISEDMTYDFLRSSEENLWSILYLTGYLTRAGESEHPKSSLLPYGTFALKIPNAEIMEIFETTVAAWFEENARTWNRSKLFRAVWERDVACIESEMTRLLRKTISYHDYSENYYHAFLAGIFAGAGYQVESNKEHGEGRSDIIVKDYTKDQVAVFEAKYSKSIDRLQKDCESALAQIDERMYAEEFSDDYKDTVCYGIAFYKKRCKILTKSKGTFSL